ncbi:MAG: transposase [Nitrososphaerota archaeon]|nr:transposase [Nitrososphaerota archaeon]
MQTTLKNKTIPIPEKRITYKKATNGTTYLYYTQRAYRNKKGKPTSDEISIGKKDTKTGNLIPNKNYYNIFQTTNPPQTTTQTLTPNNIQTHGTTTTLTQIANQTGLTTILKNTFPTTHNQLLATAYYILCKGNVMMYIEDWFNQTNIDFTPKMTDIDTSRLFASITNQERKEFFKQWIKHRGEQEYIAYDVSSLSTYSNNINIAEWGYNRDQENLPQVNLEMYYGMTTQIPVYYDVYSGSIPDKTYMEFMMATAKDLGITKVCFILDRGFETEDNLIFLRNQGFSFITAMPSSRVDVLRFIDENKSRVRSVSNWIKEYDVYGVKCEVELFGLKLWAHVYYDSEKQSFDEKELYACVERLQSELGKMSGSKGVSRRYRDFFVVEETGQGVVLSFELDTVLVDVRLGRAGFFVLLCSRGDLSSGEVLGLYRGRDVVEKGFCGFKNGLDFRRVRTHWVRTLEGKLFVGFLALVLRSYMGCLLRGNVELKRLTFDKVLLELEKIRIVTMSDMSQHLIPLTKLQKTILTTLKVPIETLTTKTDSKKCIL